MNVKTDKPHWEDPRYRHAYASAAIEQSIAWQLRINREKRGWSHEELAHRSKVPLETVIALEDNEGLDLSVAVLRPLIALAEAMDIALRLDFISFETLNEGAKHLGEEDLYIPPYLPHIPQM